MKRFAWLIAAVALVLLLSPNHAYAICQKCNNDRSTSAMCSTINACDQGATMSACAVEQVFNPDGSLAYRYCDAIGTTQGPECNGNDPSCHQGGGGGTGGGGGSTGGKIPMICMSDMFGGCDAGCDFCVPFCWILC